MLRLKYNIKEFVVVVIVGLFIYCAYIYNVANNSTYKYAIELWNYGKEIFHLMYPLFFTIPFCWVLFHEKSGGYWKNVFNRTELRTYIRKRIFIAAFFSATAMLIISIGSLLFAYLIVQPTVSDYEPIMTYSFYGAFQINHPVLYALILSCWRSILAVLFTVLGIGVTMISNNIFIAMTGAFVYSIVENFITAILQVPQLSICTSFYPNRLTNTVITFPKLMVGPAIMVIAIILIYIYYCKKVKSTVLD